MNAYLCICVVSTVRAYAAGGFTDFQQHFNVLLSEASSMKLEMVTRRVIGQLESRVIQLGSNVISADVPDAGFLQDQFDLGSWGISSTARQATNPIALCEAAMIPMALRAVHAGL